jgi:acyl carrier protein
MRGIRLEKATVMDISDRTRQQRIDSIVREFIKIEPKDRVITPDESLADLGLTSVDTVNLMLAIEAEFDLTIPGTKLIPANFESVLSIERLVSELSL